MPIIMYTYVLRIFDDQSTYKSIKTRVWIAKYDYFVTKLYFNA